MFGSLLDHQLNDSADGVRACSREALDNVAEHAEAGEVTVRIVIQQPGSAGPKQDSG